MREQSTSPFGLDGQPRAAEAAWPAGRDVTARYFGSDLLGQETMIATQARITKRSKNPPPNPCPRIPNTCASIIMTFLSSPLRRSLANIARFL
jgi:hypothetical protein